MFNTNSLILENLNTSSVFEEISVDENLFLEALQYVTEMRKEVIEEKRILYKNILESNNSTVVVTESFDGFFNAIKNIINKFIEFIKKLFNKFSIAMHKLVGSEKYILKNRAALRAYNSDCEFSMEVYNYTFSDNIPSSECAAKFNEEFIGLGVMFADKDEKDTKAILQAIGSSYGELKAKLESNWYDNFRGDVIGKPSIPQDQFSDELFEVFRNGVNYKSNETVSSTMIDIAYDRIDKYKKSLTSCKSTKDKLEREYNSVKTKVEKLIKVNNKDKSPLNFEDIIDSGYDTSNISYKGTVNGEVVLKLDAFTKLKCDQITEMSAIHALAFAAKLEAIKECYTQDKKLLYTTLQRVNKKKGVVKDGK